MAYSLPHESVLIGCGKRTDSVQPEEDSISRRRKNCCTPSSCLGGPNGPTEPEQMADYFMYMDTAEDERVHHLAVACAKFTVRTDSVGEAQDFFHGPKHVFFILERNE